MARPWEELFLYALAETGNVSEALKVSGAARKSAYRARQEDAAFAAAWVDALEEATDALEMEARRRAKEGIVRPHFYAGVKVADVREYSDVLLIFLLKAHRPEKFREPRGKLGIEDILALLPTALADQLRPHLTGEVPVG